MDPWGGQTDRSGGEVWQQTRKYTTYERDANGSDEAMHRRYNRRWSKFDQPDPYDGSYDLSDPQSFNRYAYVSNDPVNFVDPSGLKLQGSAAEEKCVTLENGERYCWDPRDVVVVNTWAWSAPIFNPYYWGADRGFESGDTGRGSIPSIDVDGGGGRGSADTNDAAINRIISACGIGASLGQFNNVSMDGTMFRGLNGNWYPMSGRGPNQYTGARSLATGKASAFGALGRAAGYGGIGLSAVQGYRSYKRGDNAGVAKSTLDAGMGYVGLRGGVPGAIASGVYFGVDLTVGWDGVGRAVANDPRDPCNGRARQMLTNKLGPPPR